jgi:hypothetical protein
MEALRQDDEPLEVVRAVYRSLKGTKNGGEVRAGDAKSVAALACAFSVPERVLRGVFEVQLASSSNGKWRNYYPGLEVRRTNGQVVDGSRFDE